MNHSLRLVSHYTGWIFVFCIISFSSIGTLSACPRWRTVDKPGNHCIVTDTANGRSWSSPTSTLGLSASVALSANPGYQLATTNEGTRTPNVHYLQPNSAHAWQGTCNELGKSQTDSGISLTQIGGMTSIGYTGGWLTTDSHDMLMDHAENYVDSMPHSSPSSFIFFDNKTWPTAHYLYSGFDCGLWLVMDVSAPSLIQPDIAVVPEPETIALLCIGLVVLAVISLVKRRRK